MSDGVDIKKDCVFEPAVMRQVIAASLLVAVLRGTRIVCFPALLLSQFASFEESKARLFWLGLSLLSGLVNLTNQLPLPLLMVLWVRILDLREFVTFNLPTNFTEQSWHRSPVCHMPGDQ